MRRLTRYLFTLCAAVSLLLFVAACVLWVRSHSHAESIERAVLRPEGRGVFDHWCMDSVGGKLIAWRCWSTAGPTMSDETLAKSRAGRITDLSRKPESMKQWRTDNAFYSILQTPSYPNDGDVPPGARGKLFAWGFGLGRAGSGPNKYEVIVKRSVMAPHWFAVLLTAVLPAAWSVAFLWHRRRRLHGMCRSCGYDLRASPERCPECGTVPPVKATT
jgi:hypothetical protein